MPPAAVDTSPPRSAHPGAGDALPALAVAVSFLGSLLLFAFEPFVGKLLLPAFGGTPLLWNTCMVFFQVALLVGYLYALALTRIATSRAQLCAHVAVLTTLFAAYPASATPPAHLADSPLAALVSWLLAHALLPFLGLAALTTLVQAWFSRSSHPSAASPYRLYAASNSGSMFGLFAYPLLLEPNFSLSAQRSAFLGLVALLILLLAMFGRGLGAERPSTAPTEEDGLEFSSSTALLIVGLTAVPASLLLGVTNYVLTDIASLPFFWTIPLAIYLATFILAFGRRLDPLPSWFGRATSLCLLAVVTTLTAEANSPAAFLIPLHLAVFFACSLFCHVRVTALQPATRWLPQYYLAISVGGALGGMITLLVPPLVTDGLVEYPAALILASLVIVPVSALQRRPAAVLVDVLVAALLVLAGTWTAARYFPASSWSPALPWLPAAFFTLGANDSRSAFATRLAAMVLASSFVPSPFGHTIFAERNFFGRVRVTVDGAGEFHRVVHGSTIHGIQKVEGMAGCHPASYYHPSGPAGLFLSGLPAATTPRRVALIGLGSGALLCYARPGELWDLFEINPAMARVATDPRFFTFVTNSAAAGKDILAGDARLALAAKAGARYDLMVVDAFSSDAIPLHLLTSEAIQGYARHLDPGGLLLFHISNRFFRLHEVLADVGATAGLGAYVFEDLGIDEAAEREGKTPSTWLILAGDEEARSLPAAWKRVATDGKRVWTDEYSNPLGAMHWN